MQIIENKKKAFINFFVLGLIIFSLLPIWLVKFPPLQDYPQHLVLAKIIKDYANPAFNYNQYFTISYSFIPNFSCYIIISLLSYIFPILIAGKLFLSLYVVLLPLSIFYFLNAIDKEKAILGFFSFPLIYNGFFNMGFINFCFSIPLFFFSLGYWWKNKENIYFNKQMLVFFMLILGLYLSHIFSFCLLGIATLYLAIVELKNLKKIFLNLFPFLPIVILCFFLFLLPLSNVKSGTTEFRPFIHKFFLFKCIFVTFSSNTKATLISILFVICISFLFFKNFNKSCTNIFFFLTILLLVIFFALPYCLKQGWAYADSRIIPFIVFAFIASISLNRKVTTSYVCIVSIILLSIFWILHITNFYVSTNKKLENYFTVLQKIPANQNILPIEVNVTKREGEINPYNHFWAYYHIFKGGGSPFLFGVVNPWCCPVNYKNYSLVLPPPLNTGNIPKVDFKNFINNYDYILIYGKNTELNSKINQYSSLFFSQDNISVMKVNK